MGRENWRMDLTGIVLAQFAGRQNSLRYIFSEHGRPFRIPSSHQAASCRNPEQIARWALHLGESLLDVSNQVTRIFEPHGDTHQLVRDSNAIPFFFGNVTVGHGGGVLG